MEQDLVNQAGVPYRAIPAAGVHGVSWRKLPGNLVHLSRGLLSSGRILSEFNPDVLFFTGGYVAGPMALAGRRIPTLVYVPDIEPGLALKLLARLADRIIVTAPESRAYFKKNVIVSGYPLRPELSQWKRKAARSAMKLTSTKPTLLVYGGSKGAHSLNTAIFAGLPSLLESAEVIHITGELDRREAEDAGRSLSPAMAKRYHSFPYLHEMGQALASADLVVSRAGASSLGELPYFGVPAILVPYPHAWRYQKVNADYLADNGAAVVLEDRLLGDALLSTVRGLLEDPDRRARMQKAMQRLSQPGAAHAIASQLVELAGDKSQ